MQLAWRAAREQRARPRVGAVARRRARVQIGYLVWQLHDYVDELHASAAAGERVRLDLLRRLLGADHLHVLAGVLLNAWLLVRLSPG